MSSGFGFSLVILFLLFDYGRPQDFVPVIGALRPGMILTALMVIAWLRSRGTARSVSCPQLSWMLVMLVLMAVHIPFSVNHFWAFETTESFLLLLPFSVSVILFMDTPQRVVLFFRWWVVLAAFTAVRALLHPGGEQGVGSSFLGDRNDVALLLCVMLPFVVCIMVYEKRRTLKLAYLAVAILCVGGIVSTSSRGGFVGLLAVMAVLWWVSPRKLLVLIMLGVLSIGTYAFVDQQYIDRISTTQETEEGTAKGRLDSWKAAWAMFKDYPLGVGPSNFPTRFPEYQGTSFGAHRMWGRAAHSLWFTILAELGIPGALLYFLIFRANWRSLRHLNELSADPEQGRLAKLMFIAFVASLAGFFAAGTFLSVLFYPHYWFLTGMIVATEKTLAPVVPATSAGVALPLPPQVNSGVPAVRDPRPTEGGTREAKRLGLDG